jgi:hypothetical protein
MWGGLSRPVSDGPADGDRELDEHAAAMMKSTHVRNIPGACSMVMTTHYTFVV